MKSFPKTILICLLVICTLQPFPTMVSAQGESWLSGWDFRKSHDIVGATGAGTDYQVMIITEFGTGTDLGNTLYLGENSQTDFDDIRFTDNDGETLLDYWRENYTSSDTATFWVQVQDNLSIDVVIYVYYGNSIVNTTSNGDDTFEIFSDFGRYFDLETWSRYSAADDYVYAGDISYGTVDTIGKAEGLAYDGEFYYIATYNYSAGGSTAWLYKVNNTFDIEDSIEITDGSLTHSGGICLYNGHLYVVMAEPIASPSSPSKLKRYLASDLSYIDTLINSSSYSNDHWSGAVIIEELDRMYVGNWGTAKLYVFEIDGDYVTIIDSPPDIGIQDMVYIEEDDLIYGSKYEGGGADSNIISVWKPEGNGNSLTKVGEVLTTDKRTKNGFTWYNDNFYTAVAEPDDAGDVYIRRLSGSDLEAEIFDYYIYNGTTIGSDVMIEARVKMGGNRKFNLGFAQGVPTTGTQIIFHNQNGDCYLYEGNEDDDCNFDIDQDVWTTLSLGWVEDHAKGYKNRGSEHQTDDVDIPATALLPHISLWGSADAPINVSWIFIRNWVLIEPSHSDWQTIDFIEFIFPVKWTPEQQFGYDAFFIFLGLIMIPVSTMYLVRGGRKDMSTNKLFYALIVFVVGLGLLIGGIMP